MHDYWQTVIGRQFACGDPDVTVGRRGLLFSRNSPTFSLYHGNPQRSRAGGEPQVSPVLNEERIVRCTARRRATYFAGEFPISLSTAVVISCRMC